jgi:hypothetical protein
MVERRMVESVRIVVIFNEKHSCVAFPNLKGRPDLNAKFYMDSPTFHELCVDYFAFQWKHAGAFDESKLTHEV